MDFTDFCKIYEEIPSIFCSFHVCVKKKIFIILFLPFFRKYIRNW